MLALCCLFRMLFLLCEPCLNSSSMYRHLYIMCQLVSLTHHPCHAKCIHGVLPVAAIYSHDALTTAMPQGDPAT